MKESCKSVGEDADVRRVEIEMTCKVNRDLTQLVVLILYPPIPYTLYPIPYTLFSIPYIVDSDLTKVFILIHTTYPTPYTLHPIFYILDSDLTKVFILILDPPRIAHHVCAAELATADYGRRGA